jgi:hypothetical protein
MDKTLPPGPMAANIRDKYRAIGRHGPMFQIVAGGPMQGGRQVEFYPPWESQNPIPGSATVEVFNTAMPPSDLENVVVADAMHYFGAIDPRTNRPVDPTFWKLKQQFAKSLTPEQIAIDRRAYERAKAGEFGKPETRPYDQWFDIHRLDQYLGAQMLPEGSPDKRDWMSGMTPEQLRILDAMQTYLRRGSIAPGMNR